MIEWNGFQTVFGLVLIATTGGACLGSLLPVGGSDGSDKDKAESNGNGNGKGAEREKLGTIATASSALEAADILQKNCYSCHGKDGNASGGVSNILKAELLRATGKVIAGRPADSPLIKLIKSGAMPPPSSNQAPLSPSDIAVLEAWVTSGARDFEIGAKAPRTFRSPSQVSLTIRNDLLALPESSRPHIRYFSLVHLYNAGFSDQELDTQRQGLAKLVNSLSFSRDVIKPVPLDETGTVLRIDERDYRWPATTWADIIRRYTYGQSLPVADTNFFFQETGCQTPVIRADWFMKNASIAPLYNEILQLPNTFQGLQDKLNVNVNDNIKARRVARAGTSQSGVAIHNRMLERHDSPFGALWVSYDFANSSSAQKNLFASPLGPGNGERQFLQDGGEMIFNLPNGLQGYFVTNGAGKQIDEAPIAIVSDPSRPDRIVRNGLSCMGCHNEGIRDVKDQIRDTITLNPNAFNLDEITEVQELYVPSATLQGLITRDQTRFLEAQGSAGVNKPLSDPISASVLAYESSVDLALVAAELGVPVQELKEYLTVDIELGRAVGVLRVEGGTIQREVFEKLFPALLTAFSLGRPVTACELQ